MYSGRTLTPDGRDGQGNDTLSSMIASDTFMDNETVDVTVPQSPIRKLKGILRNARRQGRACISDSVGRCGGVTPTFLPHVHIPAFSKWLNGNSESQQINVEFQLVQVFVHADK